jgi:hypothetical protein
MIHRGGRRALFRSSANIYVSKLRFAVVWLGQIHNLDTGHVYVLGLKSGSERLWSHYFSVPLYGIQPSHRYEFGPPKFFSKTFKFSIIIYPTWQISGGGQCRKACRSRKKESKQSEITWKQSEPVRSISKIEKRREFVRALWQEQCPKISFKRLYTLKGLLVLVEKASFLKEFRSEF